MGTSSTVCVSISLLLITLVYLFCLSSVALQRPLSIWFSLFFVCLFFQRQPIRSFVSHCNRPKRIVFELPSLKANPNYTFLCYGNLSSYRPRPPVYSALFIISTATVILHSGNFMSYYEFHFPLPSCYGNYVYYCVIIIPRSLSFILPPGGCFSFTWQH